MKKRLFLSVFVALIGSFMLAAGGFLFQLSVPRALALNDIPPGESGWSSQYEYINLDTVWHKNDTLVFDKPVFIDNNATLTIEAGANVYLNGGALDVNWGNIVASGTETEPIVFTSDNNTPFTITFVDYEEFWESYVGKTSLLQYVDIRSGGVYNDPDVCGVMARLREVFIPTAYAAGGCPWGNPAVHYLSGRVTIDHANFIGNHYADILVDGGFFDYNRTDFLHVSHSNFGDNIQSTAVLSQAFCSTDLSSDECREKVVMRDNWWGNINGPLFAGSLLETSDVFTSGNKIDGDGMLLFRPFAPEAFTRAEASVGCAESCFSNVLFLPGVEASRLYTKDDPDCTIINCENQLWEPNRNEDVKELYLDVDGKSASSHDIYTRDVLDEVDIAGSNIYESFIDKMDVMKNDDHLINDWQAVPYDWRLSLEDILNGGTALGDGNISYDGTSIAPHIIGELKRLAASSRTGKVTIVTHSNGGLVAKALMQKIGDEETQRLIDEVVMVGAPQIGTPAAIGAMLHGYEQDLLGGLILSKPTARGLAEYMSSAYTLLPSDAYFNAVETPVVTFDNTKLLDWSRKYGEVIDTQEGMRTFLTDAYKRVDATDSDIESPTKLHANLLNAAENRHEDVDNWKAPDGVKIVQIAGWGVPATVSGIHYTTETKVFCERNVCSAPHEVMKAQPVFTVDGDGTVVTPSALWMGEGERYWVNLKQYNKTHIFSTVISELSGKRGVEHSGLFDITEINDFIADIITHTSKPIDEYTYIATQVPPTDSTRLQYSLHSPLSLSLTDDQGRHTGLDKDGKIEEQIPGTYYRQFGEVKYIFANEDAPFHVNMEGYDTGTFTFEVEELSGDDSLGKVIFKDVPTTAKTKVSLDTTEKFSDISALHVDEDGDGKQDFHLQPKIGEVVAFDATAPVTTPIIKGTVGLKDWYVSDVLVSFDAIDNESGVFETRYSLDDGKTWTVYAEPFTMKQEGLTNIQYFSENKQGIKEDVHTIGVKIDKTAPEAQIAFDPLVQKINVIGLDAISTASVSVKNNVTMVTDEAGHVTTLMFAPEKEKKEKDQNDSKLALQSITYDGVKTDVSKAFLKYEFSFDKKSKTYREFEGLVKSQSDVVRVKYRSKDTITIIVQKASGIGDDDDIDENDAAKERRAGLVVPGLRTEKGKITIYY